MQFPVVKSVFSVFHQGSVMLRTFVGEVSILGNRHGNIFMNNRLILKFGGDLSLESDGGLVRLFVPDRNITIFPHFE